MVRKRSWRRFFLLIGIFFVVSFIACQLPTPGEWSDIRSQWLPAALVAAICVVLIVVTAVTYWRGGPLCGLQASLLGLIFGLVLVFMLRELYVSALFLRVVRSSHTAVSSGAELSCCTGRRYGALFAYRIPGARPE